MRYVTRIRLGKWKFTQTRPSEMMNASHNNISGINQKQDWRENEINQVNQDLICPICRLRKRCHGQGKRNEKGYKERTSEDCAEPSKE